MTDSTEKPDECDCCGYETAELKLFQGLFSEYTKGEPSASQWYCDLCASTRTSSAHRYPSQYRGELATMQTVCYVGNVILDALKKRG